MILLFLSIWAVVIALNEALFAMKPFALSEVLAALPHTMIFSVLLTVGVSYASKRIHEALAKGQSLDKQFVAELTPEVQKVVAAASEQIEQESDSSPRVFPTQGEIESTKVEPTAEEKAAKAARVAEQIKEEKEAAERAIEEALLVSPMPMPPQRTTEKKTVASTTEKATISAKQCRSKKKAQPKVVFKDEKSNLKEDAQEGKESKVVAVGKSTLQHLENLLPTVFRREEEKEEEDLPDLMPADHKSIRQPVGFDFSQQKATIAQKKSDNERIFAERRARLLERQRAQKAREEKIAALAAAARQAKEEEKKAKALAKAQVAIRERTAQGTIAQPIPEVASATASAPVLDARQIVKQRMVAAKMKKQAQIEAAVVEQSTTTPIENTAPMVAPVRESPDMVLAKVAEQEVRKEVQAQVQAANEQVKRIDPRIIIKQRMAQKAQRERYSQKHQYAEHALAKQVETLAVEQMMKPNKLVESAVSQVIAVDTPQVEAQERVQQGENVAVVQHVASVQQTVVQELKDVKKGGVEFVAKERHNRLDTSALQRYRYRPPKQGAGLDTSALRKASLSTRGNIHNQERFMTSGTLGERRIEEQRLTSVDAIRNSAFRQGSKTLVEEGTTTLKNMSTTLDELKN